MAGFLGACPPAEHQAGGESREGSIAGVRSAWEGRGSSASRTASQSPEVPQYREARGAVTDRSGSAEGRESSSSSSDSGRSCRRLAGARVAPLAGPRVAGTIAFSPAAQSRCLCPHGCCVPASASVCRCSPACRGASGPPAGERWWGSPEACRRRRVFEFSAAGTRRNSRVRRPGSTVARGRGVAVGTGHGGVHRDGGIQR
jgi:hypothetical protein